MDASQADKTATRPVQVGDGVRAVGGGDIDLDDHQVGPVIGIKRFIQPFYVLIQNGNLVIRVQVSRQSGQPEGRKQAVFDGAPEGAFRLGERRQDQFDFH